MGKRGPLPDDQQARWLKGQGPRPADSAGSQAKPGAPRMPASLPPAAQAAWRQIVPKLAKMRILEPVDQTALADMCLCLARLEEAEKDISERGLLVTGDRGKVKNPSCQLARQYREALLRWSQRFGLTPSDRDRIEMPAESEPKDDLMMLLYRSVAVRQEEYLADGADELLSQG